MWFVFGDIAIAVGIGFSLATAGVLASGIGLLFPWILLRIGLDPAFGAGPVATIVQDVLTIVIYFLVMTLVMTNVVWLGVYLGAGGQKNTMKRQCCVSTIGVFLR